MNSQKKSRQEKKLRQTTRLWLQQCTKLWQHAWDNENNSAVTKFEKFNKFIFAAR